MRRKPNRLATQRASHRLTQTVKIGGNIANLLLGANADIYILTDTNNAFVSLENGLASY